jgi:hypothetical protein
MLLGYNYCGDPPPLGTLWSSVLLSWLVVYPTSNIDKHSLQTLVTTTMPNYTHSWWPFEPWQHRHARATACVDIMHRHPNGGSVGWHVYDLERPSSRRRRHSEPMMTPAIQPRHSRRSYDYHRPSRRRSSERREPRFFDQYGYEIGFKHGLTNMLNDFHHDQNPSLFILSFLAMLDPGEGASGSVPSCLLQPFSYSRNIPTRIPHRDDFDRCVSKLKDHGFINVTGTWDNPRLAFRHRLTVKDIRKVIVKWLFETDLGLPFFQEITERLTSALPDKKVHHMERLVEVYKSHILRRFAPGDSELVFADLLIGAAL